MKTGAIYKITCTGNGCSYIGSSLNPKNRSRQHFFLLRKGTHYNDYLQRSFNKYGKKSIAFDVIESGVPTSAIIAKEAEYIKTLKPEFNCQMPHPTRLGAKQSDEAKRKVSVANKGRKHSEKSKLLISAALMGNRRSANNKNALKVTPPVKSLIDNLRAAGLGCRRIGRMVGLNKTTIQNVFNNRYNYGG